MKQEPLPSDAPADLRHRAKARVLKSPHAIKKEAVRAATDQKRLLHELQVHQVELEMQNAELTEAREATELLLEKYTDLYDFSPVSHFTLDTNGTVQLANQTGAVMMKLERSALVGRPFRSLIVAPQRHAFDAYLEAVFAGGTNPEADFELERSDETLQVARLRLRRARDGTSCSIIATDVTAHYLTEKALLDSATRLKLGLEVAGLALVEVDFKTNLKHLTPEAARLFGLGESAMVVPRAVVHALFHPDDLPALKPLISASLDPAADGWLSMEHRIVRPDGEVRWLRVREKVFFTGPPAARRPDRASVALLDITLEKKNEQLLRSEANRIRLATEATGVGIWEWNVITHEVRWDTQMFRIYGIEPTPQGIVSYQVWADAVLPEDLLEQEAYLRDVILRLGGGNRHFRVRRADTGECRTIQCFDMVSGNSEGKAEWVIGTNLDVTERQQSENKVRVSEIRYRRLFEAAHDGVLLLDPNTCKITEANPFMTALLGYDQSELVGRELYEIGLLKDKSMSQEMFDKLKVDRQVRYENLPLKSATGQRQEVEVVANLYDESGQAVIQCNIRDITERKNKEKTLRRLAVASALNHKLERDIERQKKVENELMTSQEMTNQLLETSRDLQEKQRHLSRQLLTAQEEERKRISRELHDVIAQSLTSISFQLTGLESQSQSAGQLREKIALARQSVEQSLDIVHQFARDLRPSMLDDLGLMPALKTYLNEFSTRTGLKIQLASDASVEQLESSVRTMFYRVAQEALTNVHRHARATQVTVIIRQVADLVSLEIDDNGVGFALEGTDGTTKLNRLGVLGMKERVEMLGGTFSIASTLNGGTSIRVGVPL